MTENVTRRMFWAAWFVGILAALIAHAAGLPWWKTWDAPDASDIGLLSALSTYSLLRFARTLATQGDR